MKRRLAALEKKPAQEASYSRKPRCRPWSAKNKMTRPAAKSKPSIPVISAARTPFTSAQSRVGVAFTSKPLWIRILRGLRPNSTPPRRPLPVTFWMTGPYFLLLAGNGHHPHLDRQRHGILREGRAARLRTLSWRERH